MNFKINEINILLLQILNKYGIERRNAEIVIDNLLEAEKSGVKSHGLSRLEHYLRRIDKGLINPNPSLSVIKETSNGLLIDADNGLGQIATQITLEKCFEKIKDNTIVIGSIRNSNHFGISGYYSRQAAEKGYLSIITSNASPSMAPWGGMDPLLGTNPISMSFPSKYENNFVFDIATSAWAKGKVRDISKIGKSIPLGIGINKFGKDTTNPEEIINGGTILPFSEHKGYGFSMFIDVLSAGLSNSNFSYEAESMFESSKVSKIGHSILLININDFVEISTFEDKTDDWFGHLKNSEIRPGFKEILIPGEIEKELLNENNDTINLDINTYEALQRLNSC